MNFKRTSLAIAMIVCAHTALAEKLAGKYDVIIEGKGNAFITTNDTFNAIYGRATGGGGFEVTGGHWKNIYGFMSVDAFHNSGNTQCFCTPTKVTFVEIGFGLKYFVPFRVGDFYIGLGALPVWLQTKDCSPYVIQKQSNWGVGGIAKLGVYFDLPRSFVIDLFANYSFAKVKGECCPSIGTVPNVAHLNGMIFGAGIGYRFN
jgi:hypothetical protein